MQPIIYNLHNIRTPLTGIGRYAIELLRGAYHANLDFYFAYNGELYNRKTSLKLLELFDNRQALPKINWRKTIGHIPFSREFYHGLDSRRFSRLAGLHLNSGAIYHDINYSPCSETLKTISTVYDLSYLRYPETHPKYRVKFLNRYLNKLAKTEAPIITISNSVKTELIEHYQIEKDRIHVTHLAANDEYKPRSLSECESILNNYRLKYKQYILSVCTLEPRKNLNRVIDAYCNLNPKLQKQYPLVIAGATGWKSNRLESKITRLQKQGLIIRLGFVPQSDLPILYSGSKVFIYPSLYEGFGLPLLEAMQSGCACITSNTGALAEVSNNHAYQVNPLMTDHITDGMNRLLIDTDLNSHHAKVGLNRANDFSWSKTIAQTQQLYNEL